MEFNNTEIAFSYKSNYELRRAYYLFKLLSLGFISKIGRKLLKILISINFPLDLLILKTIYAQFCGGRDIYECEDVIDNLKKNKVYSILDYSIEGSVTENDFENSMNKCLNILSECKSKNLSKFIVFKPSAVGRFSLYKKVSSKLDLDAEEENEWNRVENRFNKICLEASKTNIMVLVDAEESWIQNAIDELVYKMMKTYNKNKAIVFNTLQAYRRDRFEYLTKLHNNSSGKFKIGVKLVRGAYMEKERDRAAQHGYPSPIQPTKAACDTDYDAAVSFLMENIDIAALCAGSHNEKSNENLAQLMRAQDVAPGDSRVFFSQLLGMSDHISYTLAKCGYNVAKYVPYGPVREVIPYLIRRAEENSSIAGQTSRELTLLLRELKRRSDGGAD